MCTQTFIRPARQGPGVLLSINGAWTEVQVTLSALSSQEHRPFNSPSLPQRASFTQTFAELNRIKPTLVLRGSYPTPTPPRIPRCADHIHPRV